MMKVTIIANISANGKVLLSDNPHHQLPREAMDFYISPSSRKFGHWSQNLQELSEVSR